MAKNKTKKRLRKALRKEQRRGEARRHPLGPDRGSGPNEPGPRERVDWPDQDRARPGRRRRRTRTPSSVAEHAGGGAQLDEPSRCTST